jgi:hypothetical protein
MAVAGNLNLDLCEPLDTSAPFATVMHHVSDHYHSKLQELMRRASSFGRDEGLGMSEFATALPIRNRTEPTNQHPVEASARARARRHEDACPACFRIHRNNPMSMRIPFWRFLSSDCAAQMMPRTRLREASVNAATCETAQAPRRIKPHRRRCGQLQHIHTPFSITTAPLKLVCDRSHMHVA